MSGGITTFIRSLFYEHFEMLLTKKKEILVTGSRVYRELDNRANKTRRTAGINRFRSDYV